VTKLEVAVTAALDRTGLYHDEAVAMVSTWKRQWFRTPGLRAFFLMPQSWTEASIPLHITPKPDVTRRVMMMRMELITPSDEAKDIAMLPKFVESATRPEAEQWFKGLGRFAEPRLRRALEADAGHCPCLSAYYFLDSIAAGRSADPMH
jgi:hypothetical protein